MFDTAVQARVIRFGDDQNLEENQRIIGEWAGRYRYAAERGVDEVCLRL